MQMQNDTSYKQSDYCQYPITDELIFVCKGDASK